MDKNIIAEAKRLREKEFMPIREIGKILGYSYQSINNAIGGCKGKRYRKGMEKKKIYAIQHPEKTNSELSKTLNVSRQSISNYRRGIRYTIDESNLKYGVNAEDIVSEILFKNGFHVEKMKFGFKYDLLVNGKRINVKAAYKQAKPKSKKILVQHGNLIYTEENPVIISYSFYHQQTTFL